jgi:3-hydroxymyristoyl/3-hydroxydecanoyl-(acyl carrier protein) dehydratase
MPTSTDPAEPVILERRIESNRADYRLYLPPNLVYFRGHFPQHPVLPGVVQVHWAVALAAPLGIGGSLEKMERLKFNRLLTPGTTLKLSLATVGPGTVEFRYHDSEGTYSSGRLRASAP